MTEPDEQNIVALALRVPTWGGSKIVKGNVAEAVFELRQLPETPTVKFTVFP